MQPSLVFALAAATFVNMCARDVWADDQPLNQCLRLGPEVGATNLLDLYATTVHQVTLQVLTREVGYALGYVDFPDAHGNGALDPNPKQILVHPTTRGLYIIRILDLPPGVGLHGPF
jgi:hypothetical protein